MTATVAHKHQPWISVLNLLLAGTALVVAVFALHDDRAGTNEITRTPNPPTVADEPVANDSARYPFSIDGCDRARGMHPC